MRGGEKEEGGGGREEWKLREEGAVRREQVREGAETREECVKEF